MSRHGSQGRLSGKVRTIQKGLEKGDVQAIRQLLPAERIREALEKHKVRFNFCSFTPLVTIWMFLGQMLSADGSCREAVAKLAAMMGAGAVLDKRGRRNSSHDPDTGPYCKARQRLPESLLAGLARQAGRELHERHPSGKILGGRPVKVVDGTTVSMPDTSANQKAWPQPSTQKPGLGFPLMRIVAVMSLNCAAVLDVAVGPYKGKQTGESALLRTLLDSLEKGDILLADRYYASYWMIALLLGRGVDCLFRQHQQRKVDLRTGRRLGHEDHEIKLTKAPQRPEWMDQETYDRMPYELTVRELRIRVHQRGFRVKSLVLVTTLLDEQEYTKAELAEAFRRRWCAELDLRSIKQTMQMSVLRCKSPDMVRKEMWMRLLAYNLIRGLMTRAAEQAGIESREVSFAGAVQAINAFAPILQLAQEKDLPRLTETLLRTIARHRVGNRPNRFEPRAVKRRAKPIAWLTVPRETARKHLAKS